MVSARFGWLSHGFSLKSISSVLKNSALAFALRPAKRTLSHEPCNLPATSVALSAFWRATVQWTTVRVCPSFVFSCIALSLFFFLLVCLSLPLFVYLLSLPISVCVPRSGTVCDPCVCPCVSLLVSACLCLRSCLVLLFLHPCACLSACVPSLQADLTTFPTDVLPARLPLHRS